ncbi:MAG: VanW family protein [Clostridia bacterium]|nr:VanW family protein [Clostridia bacterium]MDD6041157.1 VanW family protein [Clostridia bacterium]
MAADRFRDTIVNEAGEFAAPVSLHGVAYESMIDPAGQPQGDDFVFDDEPSWNQPVAAAPVRPAAKPAGENRKITRGDSSGRNGKRRRGGWRAYGYVLAICLSLAGIFVLGIMMIPQLAGFFWRDFDNFAFINGELLRYDPAAVTAYKQYRAYMDRDVIYPGIFIDGVHVGDMTIEEAREALGGMQTTPQDAFRVTVAIGNKTWTLDPSNLPASRDLGNVLEKAYAIGRSNTTEIQTTLRTPFRERADMAVALRQNGVNLTTSVTYDHEAVRGMVEQIAAYVTREPIDAQIQSFDYNTRTFTFTESQPGVTIDQQLLYERIIAALDGGEKDATVTIDPIITEPNVTTAQMMDRFTLISAYTTKTTNDANRNTNIRLACEAINGTALLPGETFSFNEATGQRTTAKGYKSAGAIAAGQSIEEVGGGICQVSSTIFNAVARANLQITSRSPHAWPSTYVNIGEDATVNWPNLDFKFTNNTNSPIFLIAYYKDRQMSAEIWGMSLGEGVTIDLESTIVQTNYPPSEPKYVYNPEMEYGLSKTTVKARTGYVVETYKVWYKDGVETSRELMHKSTYKPYQQVIEYNYELTN